ncbi:zinc metalloprotease HtpX [Candidatus Babeliales bacterium]|nr:zinc metalloprotease HtpX [Candidatus Babeliales bacterium]
MFLNSIKTAALLAGLSGLMLLMGHWIGGNSGILFAFIFSLLLNFVTYFYSDKIVLAMYGAKPLDQSRFQYIYDMVQDLCDNAKMPMPKLWYLPTSMANAFATGRNPQHASVAVTQGILDLLTEDELRGVLAHEISHIKNRDILIGTIAATIATAIGYLANMLQWAVLLGYGHNDRDNRSSGLGALVVAIVMPFAAMLIQLAVSRAREYQADESGAHHCHDPLALASALEKLHDAGKHSRTQPSSPAQAASASLFIVYPFSGKGMMSLFSTHPPMEKRIERLRKMAGMR